MSAGECKENRASIRVPVCTDQLLMTMGNLKSSIGVNSLSTDKQNNTQGYTMFQKLNKRS